jgi:Holliday junction resolvase
LSAAKAKGTQAETAIVNYLNEQGVHAMRNPPQGAKDKGDINIHPYSVVIEVKNHKKFNLADWVDQATTERDNAKAQIGIVWHKRIRKGSPGEWYVTMNGEDFLKLLEKSNIVY